MTERNTGGPAFPTPMGWDSQGNWSQIAQENGMTLRDYFAAQALPSLMANSGGYWSPDSLQRYATLAYDTADAMLEARK